MPCQDATRRRYSTLELSTRGEPPFRGSCQQSQSPPGLTKPSNTARNSVIGVPSAGVISERTLLGVGRSDADEHGYSQGSKKDRVNASSSGSESLLATVPNDISRKLSPQSMRSILALNDSGEHRKSVSPINLGPGSGPRSGGGIAGIVSSQDAPSSSSSSSTLSSSTTRRAIQHDQAHIAHAGDGATGSGLTPGNASIPEFVDETPLSSSSSRTSSSGYRTMDSRQTYRRKKATSISAGQPVRERPGFFRRIFGFSTSSTQHQGPESPFSPTPEEPPVLENVPLSSPLQPHFRQSLDAGSYYNFDNDEISRSSPSIDSATGHFSPRERHLVNKTSNLLCRRKKSSSALTSPHPLRVPRMGDPHMPGTSPSKVQQFAQFLRTGRDPDPPLGPMTARLAREGNSNAASSSKVKGFNSPDNQKRQAATANQADVSIPSPAYLPHSGAVNRRDTHQRHLSHEWDKIQRPFACDKENQGVREGRNFDDIWKDGRTNAEATSRGPQVNIQNFSPLAPGENGVIKKADITRGGSDNNAAFDHSWLLSSKSEVTPLSSLYVDTPGTSSPISPLSRQASDTPERIGNTLRAQRSSPQLSGINVCDQDQTFKAHGSASSRWNAGTRNTLQAPRIHDSPMSPSSPSSNSSNGLIQVTQAPDIKNPLQQVHGDTKSVSQELFPGQRMKTSHNSDTIANSRSSSTFPMDVFAKDVPSRSGASSPVTTRRDSLGHDSLTRTPSSSASKSFDCPSRDTEEFLAPLSRSISVAPSNEERPGTASTASTADARAMNQNQNESSLQDLKVAQVLYDLNDPLLTHDVTKNKPIAEWLGAPEQSSMRKAYMKIFDFQGLNILEALRHLCSHLPLKAETQQIDRILDAFSHRWCECNPEHFFIVSGKFMAILPYLFAFVPFTN